MDGLNEIKTAAELAGVAPLAVKRAMDATGQSAEWSAYYAQSRAFAVKPRFTDSQSSEYAEKMMAERKTINPSLDDIDMPDLRTTAMEIKGPSHRR